MKILIIGGGGREHALAWKIAASPRVTKLYAAPGSDAIAAHATCVTLDSHEAIVDFATREAMDLVVVGPEAPLVGGLADRLNAAGLKVFGPSAAAAQLEGSKVFSKAFMVRHGIPTASHRAFSDVTQARSYVENQAGPWVIKADGLAAGKGVIIAEDQTQALAALDMVMVQQTFGRAGTQVVIEAFLRGEEASYFVITDGTDFITLPACQDHKAIGDLDRGPNTGGMGAYCPAPVVTAQVEQRVLDQVVRPTLAGMAAEGHPYTGVLFVGLMISEGSPYVIEYNCRFGDPECQPLMLALESDLVEVLEAAVNGRLGQVKPRWRPGAAACVVLASGGYPGAYEKGRPITGLDRSDAARSLQIFHAGTRRQREQWLTQGGRVLGVTAWGATLGRALETAYQGVKGISWEGMTYRKDIGLKGMKHDKTSGAEMPSVNVGIVLGSASDMEVAEKATAILKELGVRYELAVASAHRTPERVRAFIAACEREGAEVFIAIAGMAAALPGVVAAETLKPVIGVPVRSAAFEGLDALLSIAQMPPGIPVATVAVGGGGNAALLAAHMLALKYEPVAAALKEYRLAQVVKIEDAHTKAGLSKLV
ncbi:MAG: phosphoribosylamine--glycine ligase [Deltaproteobacteria bacterium]|nr:phosphoribosylamine--glycine ligase [Deltaproteobacteria bacterium]